MDFLNDLVFGRDQGLGDLGLEDEPMVAPEGQYQVRVRIIEAKDLSGILNFSLYQSIMSLSWKTQTEAEDKLPNCQAIVSLMRDGFKTQKRKTIVEKETSTPLWNQVFHFEGIDVAEGELDALTLQIAVKDKTSIGRALTIGTCDLNLDNIYAMKGHETWNEWLTLTDTSGRREGSQGQILVCVTVLESKDQPVVHGDEDSEEEGFKMAAAPPSGDNLTPSTWILKANAYSARDLPRMDYFGKAGIDAYLRLQCGSAKPVKTRNKRSRNPDWNQELILKIIVPPGKGGISNMPPVKLSLMDADFDADDHVASLNVQIRDLLDPAKKEAYLQPTWYSFYGGPREIELAWFSKMSKLAKRMNAGYVEGSAYRGRALLTLSLAEEKWFNKGQRAKKKIPSVLEKGLGQEWPVFVHCELYSLELHNSRHVGRTASVALNMGLVRLQSPGKALRSEGGSISKDCYAHFNVKLNAMRVKIPQPFEGASAGEGAPDLFIDVCVGKNRIGYCRVKVKDLMPVKEVNMPIKGPDSCETWKREGWFPLHADAIGGHKLGVSRRAEHVRPVGRVLLRLQLQGSPTAKRDAKTMSPDELKALEQEEAQSSDDEDGDKDPEAAAAAGSEKRAEALARKTEMRAMRAAAMEPPEQIPPLPTQTRMLKVQLYQARGLPSSDADGASDPFAVVRCGRVQAKTQIIQTTTSPAWFKEMLMYVELPSMPRPPPAPRQDGDSDGAFDSDADEEGGAGEGELDLEAGGAMSLAQASARGIKPGMGGGRRTEISGFEGIAWWAAPKLSVTVLDHDEGLLGGDVDPLSLCELALCHPNRKGRGGGGLGGGLGGADGDLGSEDGFSSLASSASFWTDMSVGDMPDDYADLKKYKVGEDKPEWYPMLQLNPVRSGAVDWRNGGRMLMNYALLDTPKEGLYAFAGEKPPKGMFGGGGGGGKFPRIVRELGDFFNSTPVEVQVLCLGLRGMEAYKGIPVTYPLVEIELAGAMPLFPGSHYTIQKTSPSMSPSGANANFAGEVLRLCGRWMKDCGVEVSLSIRVLDQLPFKRTVGSGEYKLRMDADEEEEEELGADGQPIKLRKLKPMEAKPLTAEELREIECAEMASTASERSVGDSDVTEEEAAWDSETVSIASRDFDFERERRKEPSFISKAASSIHESARASAKALSKTFSKISSKQYRLERRKMKALEGKLVYEDAPPGGAIRKAGSFKGSLNRPPVSVERAGTVTKFDKKGRKKEIPVYKEVGAVIEEDLSSEDEYSRGLRHVGNGGEGGTEGEEEEWLEEGGGDGGALASGAPSRDESMSLGGFSRAGTSRSRGGRSVASRGGRSHTGARSSNYSGERDAHGRPVWKISHGKMVRKGASARGGGAAASSRGGGGGGSISKAPFASLPGDVDDPNDPGEEDEDREESATELGSGSEFGYATSRDSTEPPSTKDPDEEKKKGEDGGLETVEEGDEGAEGEGGEGAPGPEGGGAPGGGEHAEEDDEEPAGPKWDDGSGDTPEWMQQRAFLADVQLESYVRPLPFITVPIMRSKGFKDNTTELEEGGVFKFAVRVAPMIVKDDEDEDEDEDEDDEEKAKKKKAKPLMETKRMKQKRLLEENARKQAKFIVDDEQWTTPDEQWQALRRLIGGGGAALAPQEVQVRAYVVRGKNIRPIDPNGLCDPYIKANLAGTSKSYGARKDHVKETLAPWFYKTITFTTELPGPGRLRLEVYDWDKRGGDDLVGRNVIDLEDRWFNAAWNAEYQKRPPLELRPLMNPAAVGNQGNVEVILEMFDAADDPPPALRLAPPNVYDVELRVTVFKARNMVCKDAGQNDLFFKIGVVGVDHKQTRFGETQTTDTHFFATDGKGSFNYRLIYRFTIPALKAKLRVSAYDYDLIGSNDNIGEATIPLVGMCKDLIKRINRSPDGETGDTCLVTVDKKDQPQESKSLSDRSVNFLSSYLDGATEGLWVPLYHPSKDDLVQGEVELRLDLLSVKKAEQKPVGKGREQPNRDPVLGPPTRVTLNPFDPCGSLATILGPEMLRKVLIIGLCLLCLFLAASLAVFIINDVVASYINIAISQVAMPSGAGGGAGSTLAAPHFP